MKDDCDATIDETFQEPRKKFWQRASRKRTKSDAMSVSSMDVSLDSTMGKTRKRARIAELASNFLFANSTPARISGVIQGSFRAEGKNKRRTTDRETRVETSSKNCENSAGNLTIRSWMTEVAERKIGENDDSPSCRLSRNQIKRQEAIYELYCGENIVINDLETLRDFYYAPIAETDIFTRDEISVIFGDLDRLIDLHKELRDELLGLRDSAGFTNSVGPTLINWLSKISEPYLDRCRSQVRARHFLDEKRARSKRFRDFLKKKMESPRSIDIWTYLDVARSRIVKYPLLVNEIARRTNGGNVDRTALIRAAEILTDLLRNIDRAMGDAECELARSKICAKPEKDPTGRIREARELVTEGPLKDSRGAKYHCFLFDSCFVVTRRAAKSRTRSSHEIALPVVARDYFSIVETTDEDRGLKIGDIRLTAIGEHERRHWIDAFARARKLNDDEARETRIDDERAI